LGRVYGGLLHRIVFLLKSISQSLFSGIHLFLDTVNRKHHSQTLKRDHRYDDVMNQAPCLLCLLKPRVLEIDPLDHPKRKVYQELTLKRLD
jgi:hypothetical protein